MVATAPFQKRSYMKEWPAQAEPPSMVKKMNSGLLLLSSNKMTHYFKEWTTKSGRSGQIIIEVLSGPANIYDKFFFKKIVLLNLNALAILAKEFHLRCMARSSICLYRWIQYSI